MIYSLYHLVTRTHMNDNGLPWYVDVIGGIVDVTIVGYGLIRLQYELWPGQFDDVQRAPPGLTLQHVQLFAALAVVLFMIAVAIRWRSEP